MKTQIVRIGNSRGIRIPKAVLEQCEFPSEVEMRVEKKTLIVFAKTKPRQGWGNAFSALKVEADTSSTVPFIANVFDDKGWVW